MSVAAPQRNVPNPVVHPRVYTLRDRLDLIAQRIDASHRAPQKTRKGESYMLRDLALEIVRGTPQHGQQSEDGQIGAVFGWVKSNVEYRQDPSDYDLFMGAGRTISAGGSDCDDHTILNCALLSSLGFTVGAKVTSPDGANFHIYGIVGAHPFYAPSVIVPMDTTQPGSFPGWEPPDEQRRHEYITTFRRGRALGITRLR